MRTPVIGSSYTVAMTVDERVTVPGLLPDVMSWAEMPPVLATAMLVACMEWAALEALQPFLDEDERSLGVVVDMTHTAPTPVGVRVRATATIRAVDGRHVDFDVEAADDNGPVGRANHRRAVIKMDRFRDRIAAMQAAAEEKRLGPSKPA